MCGVDFDEGEKVYVSPYSLKHKFICEDCFYEMTSSELVRWMGYDMEDIEDHVERVNDYV